MKGTLVRLFTSAALLVVAVVCAWWAGHEHAHRTWAALQAQEARETAHAIDQEWERGDQAAQALRTELDTQQDRYNQLEGAYREYQRTYPLLTRTGSGAGSGHAMPAEAADVLPAGEAPPSSPPAQSGDGSDPVLTLGAVWLWNEALAQGHLPAGACGVTGTSATTCDAPSGITLSNAWDNHRVNAQICANNRIAHQRLIDYIQQTLGVHGDE